jgi:hypothetical protein
LVIVTVDLGTGGVLGLPGEGLRQQLEDGGDDMNSSRLLMLSLFNGDDRLPVPPSDPEEFANGDVFEGQMSSSTSTSVIIDLLREGLDEEEDFFDLNGDEVSGENGDDFVDADDVNVLALFVGLLFDAAISSGDAFSLTVSSLGELSSN